MQYTGVLGYKDGPVTEYRLREETGGRIVHAFVALFA
jgi:hypothetical protein